MQASTVTALVPIKAAVPVTLIVLHQPESETEPTSCKTVPLQRITTQCAAAKTVSQTIPRLVTVKAKSLLKRAKSVPNHRTSLLNTVNTSKDKKSLLKPTCKLLVESPLEQVIRPKWNTSLLKPEKTNSEPSNTKIVCLTTNQSVTDKARNLVNSVIRPKSNVSLLKPVIASQGRDFDKIKTETSKDEPRIVKLLNGEIIDNLPRHVVKTVRPAKSLLKPDTLQSNHPINTWRANLEDHAYTLNHSQVFPEMKRAFIRGKRFGGDFTKKDFKPLPRKEQSVVKVKKTLEKSREKLHPRHGKMNASIEEVSDLKKLLLDLKSRKLVTEEGHSRLAKAVDRTITILKNNFTTDPTA